MKVTKFGGHINRGGMCKYRNSTVKMTVKTGMPEGLNKRCWTFLLFYQYTALSSRAEDGHQTPIIGEASLIIATASPLPRRKFLTNHHPSWTSSSCSHSIVRICKTTNKKFVTSVHVRCKFVDASLSFSAVVFFERRI